MKTILVVLVVAAIACLIYRLVNYKERDKDIRVSTAE